MITIKFNFRPQAENFCKVIGENPSMVFVMGPVEKVDGFEVTYRKALPKEIEIRRMEIQQAKKLEKKWAKS